MTDTRFDFDRVLVIDDDPILNAIVQSFFQKRGVKDIQTAADGRAALDIVDRFAGQIDFILCDLNMPELDGLQFLRHLNDRKFDGQIAIISGEQDTLVRAAERLAHAHSLNVVGTLGKPLKLNELEKLSVQASTNRTARASASPMLATVHDLRSALHGGGVVPFYQPKVGVRNNQVCGAEALARWTHPELGVIGPNFFLPMAEENDLMPLLTERIVSAAIEDLRAWREFRLEPKVSINLCSATVNDVTFPDRMAEILEGAGLAPSKMVFEVTERQLTSNNAHASEVLARLRIMGFGVSIDDFGTGYSNIERLREFPFTELKIDQSFVRDAQHDRFADASVEASVILGKQLQLSIVAEGVETSEQLEYVIEKGVDEVQGYYFARPMAVGDFAAWVRSHTGLGASRRSDAAEAAAQR